MPSKSLFCTLTAALLASAWPAQAQQAEDYPEGPGKETFIATCGGCHDINRSVRLTPAGWNTVVNMQNFGAPVPPEEWPTVTAYLMKISRSGRAPPRRYRRPRSGGDQLWAVPTPGSRPHDPARGRTARSGGRGQMANMLGRLDPKTGEIKEYPLKTPHTGPARPRRGQGRQHLVHRQQCRADRQARSQDRAWSPSTRCPIPPRKDPHTLIFDQDGILWFTVQQANMVGRLDPEDRRDQARHLADAEVAALRHGGRFQERRRTSSSSAPTRSPASIPKTMKIKEYPLPDAATRGRAASRSRRTT